MTWHCSWKCTGKVYATIQFKKTKRHRHRIVDQRVLFHIWRSSTWEDQLWDQRRLPDYRACLRCHRQLPDHRAYLRCRHLPAWVYLLWHRWQRRGALVRLHCPTHSFTQLFVCSDCFSELCHCSGDIGRETKWRGCRRACCATWGWGVGGGDSRELQRLVCHARRVLHNGAWQRRQDSRRWREGTCMHVGVCNYMNVLLADPFLHKSSVDCGDKCTHAGRIHKYVRVYMYISLSAYAHTNTHTHTRTNAQFMHIYEHVCTYSLTLHVYIYTCIFNIHAGWQFGKAASQV